MEAKAIEQARARLVRAKSAVDSMMAIGPSLHGFEELWFSFLIAAGGMYSKLEQGSKTNGKSMAWFGRKKHERRSDDLLSYLHHARNSEEHSLDVITGNNEVRFVSKSKGTRIISGKETYTGRTEIILTAGLPTDIKIIPRGVHLLPVKDNRYNDTFLPPTKHLGKFLRKNDPVTVAELAVKYLENMLSEASNL